MEINKDTSHIAYLEDKEIITDITRSSRLLYLRRELRKNGISDEVIDVDRTPPPNSPVLESEKSKDITPPNLLDLLPPELIPFITKYLPIQDLKNCCSLDNIWKTEVIREIRKRLIVDCTFINSKTTVKALIDSKSQYNSISKALAKKMDLYITRMYGSKYPAVKDLGIGATNAGKKVMVRGWLRDEEVSISLPNIFELEPPSYLDKSYEHFLVIDKPEYDLVLGSTWLTRLGNRIDGRDGRYWESNEEKRIYYARNNIDIVSPSLYIFYELLFPKFTANNSDGEVILIEFSDQNIENTLIDLSEYYDSDYSKTESESSDSETESESSNSGLVNLPLPIIRGTIPDVKARVGIQKVNCRLNPGFLGPAMCTDKLFKKISGKIARKLTPEDKDSKFFREMTTHHIYI
ncbi:10332_t:CDS:2 [Ambispora leptoticha]|uniref:10332_t:CDS:1 n=1 Tax=Ambispora leptoticha TaxID=144679 RepID=A0A9N9GS57_9GLOM|nr:10332_t:CDS:2 [Ambispora leptoticha]